MFSAAPLENTDQPLGPLPPVPPLKSPLVTRCDGRKRSVRVRLSLVALPHAAAASAPAACQVTVLASTVEPAQTFVRRMPLGERSIGRSGARWTGKHQRTFW